MPIYNGENHLVECIESVINQTFSDWELILIDDGSTDKTLEICRSYSGDSRVKVLYQENRGVSSARNKGLDLVTGEYVTYLDSDDWFERNTLELYSKYINDTNAAFISNNSYFRNQAQKMTIVDSLPEGSYSQEVFLEAFLRFQICPSLSCSVIKKSLLQDIYLNEKIHYWEDFEYLFRIITTANRFFVFSNPLLHYRSGSVTHSFLNKNKLSSFLIKSSIAELTPQYPCLIQAVGLRMVLDVIGLGVIDKKHNRNLDRLIQKELKQFISYAIKHSNYSSKAKLSIITYMICPRLYYTIMRSLKNNSSKRVKA